MDNEKVYCGICPHRENRTEKHDYCTYYNLQCRAVGSKIGPYKGLGQDWDECLRQKFLGNR